MSDSYQLKLSYGLKMTPEAAKAFKPDPKLMIVCRLSQPWFRHAAHGHDPTIDDPYKMLVGDNYLYTIPEQIWLFNGRTGEVVDKLTGETINSEQGVSTLEVSSPEGGLYKARIDDADEKSGIIAGRKMFGAKRKIVLTLDMPQNLSAVTMKLNGKPYAPNWDITRLSGASQIIESATAAVTVSP